MAEPKDKRQGLYQELVKNVKAVDHEKAIKTCNRILHEYPEEVKAFECKIVCCTQLNRFQDVVDFTAKSPKLSGNLGYERAYCLYRLNFPSEAHQILTQMKENSLRKKELVSQVLYRMERYEESLDQFREVIKNANDQYEEERQTNLSAIVAAVAASGSERKLPVVVTETFEQKFNYACQLTAQGDLKGAEEVLKQAETVCVEYLKEDGMTEEGIEDEAAIIRIQKAYIAQRLNRVKEALRLYNAELKKKPSDAGAAAVAANNVLSINRDQNIFESKKKIKIMNLDGLTYKINTPQRKTMMANQGLYYLATNQHVLCEEIYTKYMDRFPDDCEDGMCLWISHLAKTKGLEAVKPIQEDPRVKENPDLEFKIRLGLIQQFLNGNKRSVAVALLEELAVEDYYPAIIGVLASIYLNDGQSKKAYDLIFDGVKFHRKKGTIGKENMSVLWRQAANLMMAQGQHAEAVKTLEELRTVAPDDVATLAELIVAYSSIDVSKAKALSAKLPAVPPCTTLDMELVDSPNFLATLKKKAVQESVPPTPVEASASTSSTSLKTKNKKKKKSIPAQNFKPERKPDPERWLPRYERSGFKVKKVRSKTRGNDVGKGTQGMSSEASAMYDMTARVSVSDSAIGLRSPMQKQVLVGGKKKARTKP